MASKRSRNLLLGGLAGLVVLCSWARAQDCGCQVSDRRQEAYDRLLQLSNAEKRRAEETHLPWDVPQTSADATNEHLLHQEHYIINYDDDLRLPVWVAYRLRDDDLDTHRKRTQCFRRDVRLSEDVAAFCEDYEEPIFDRGHMVPNADMTRSEAAMINTYMFSNMVPQHDDFNQKIWGRLEGYVRDWAEVHGEIYIITGAVFDKDGDGERDSDDEASRVDPLLRVAVPTHFYKIVMHQRPNQPFDSITILLSHVDSSPTDTTASNNLLAGSIKSIKDIEALTGIDFLPTMDDDLESEVEEARATQLWPRR